MLQQQLSQSLVLMINQQRLVLELYMLKLAQPYVGADELIERIEQMGENCRADINAPYINTIEHSQPKINSQPVKVEAKKETPAVKPVVSPTNNKRFLHHAYSTSTECVYWLCLGINLNHTK